MFKLESVSPTYLWPVKFSFAGENGRPVSVAFRVRFRRLDQGRIDDIMEILRSGSVTTPDITDDDLIEETVVGWEDVTADGQPLDYDDINHRAMVLGVPGCRPAIVKSWFESLTGAPEKNSARPPATGRAAAAEGVNARQ